MMIRGAYSEKYKALQQEKLDKLKEHVKTETQQVRDRAKELSKETNRRRKNLEDKKKQREEEAEKERAAALAERHKQKEEATQKFQKDGIKKKSRPGSGVHQDNHFDAQDGARIGHGHAAEIQNGGQVPLEVPSLEDALELVSNQEAFENYMSYRNQFMAQEEHYGTSNTGYMQQGYINTTPVVQPVSYVPLDTDPTGLQCNEVVNGNYSEYMRIDGYESILEQERLRQDALQNGGPRLAFMNDAQECTDGALPPTMGRESPAGSVTSLDSLDEVPQDATAPSTRLIQVPVTPAQNGTVTGIINKGAKVKSAGRRRVTFSDSIEFDDGLTGQLVTIEKDSCKSLVNWYNNRMVAMNSNSYDSNSDFNVNAPLASKNSPGPIAPPTPAAQAATMAISGIQGQAMVATTKPTTKKTAVPGSASKKTDRGEPISSPVPGSTTSMVVPMSVYAQIKSQTRQPLATVGETTSSAVTYTDHPVQKIATTNVTRNNASHMEMKKTANDAVVQDEGKRNTEEMTEIVDSLDLANDSLDGEELIDSIERTPDSRGPSGSSTTQSNGQRSEKPPKEAPILTDSPRSVESDVFDSGVDYYGKPATIYHHPFGGEIQHDDHHHTVAYHAQEPAPKLDAQLTKNNTKKEDADYSTRAGHITSAHVNKPTETPLVPQKEAMAFEIPISGISSPSQPSYYRSWYSGSFFPSKKDSRIPILGDRKGKGSIVQGREPAAPSNVSESPQGKSAFQRAERRNVTSRVVAKPPGGPRQKSAAYRSNLQKKRAAAAARQAASKPTTQPGKGKVPASPKRAGSSTREGRSPRGASHRVGVSGGRGTGRRSGTPSGIPQVDLGSSSDDDEFIQNIKRNMESLSIRGNGSPAEEYKRVMDSINYRPKNNTRLETPDTKVNGEEVYDNESVYEDQFQSQKLGTARKVHSARAGSAIGRSRQMSPSYVPAAPTSGNAAPQGKPPMRGGPFSHVGSPSKGSPVSNWASRTNSAYEQSPPYPANNWNLSPYKESPSTYEDENQSYNPQGWTKSGIVYTNGPPVNPQMATLKQSIRLDKTPTDDEINVLWDKVRLCLDQKESTSVGSDSCVNRVDVRRSRTASGPFNQHYYTTGPSRGVEGMDSGATPIAGMGTVGGLRRYGSYEVLRRHGSTDNLGYRRPLLQHRAHRVRSSSQGRPPTASRQQPHQSPVSSRQGPSPTVSATRGGPQPLSQTELRAVLQASERTQLNPDNTNEPPLTLQYQTALVGRRGPSALSMEEQRLMQSLDRLNERLQAQETNLHQPVTSGIEHRTQSAQPRMPRAQHRSPSAAHKYRTLQAGSPAR